MLYTILYYIILTIIILYILICIYVKVKFQFWSIQPVFHVYDFLYWIYPIGLVQKDLPLANKYVNLFNISVEDSSNMSDVTIKRVCNFIQSFYLRKNANVNYIPSHSSITDYFKGSMHPSYISTYKNPLKSISSGKDDYIYNLDELIGVFTARSLLLTLQQCKTIPIYYCDNLCIHPKYRKKGIAPKLIQTQYYNLRRLNKNINTFLFKREGELTAIVPVVAYESIVYSTEPIVNSNKTNYNSIIGFIEITEKNIFILKQLITDSKNIFNCIVVPEIGTLLNLIKHNHIYIYGIIINNSLVACYVFKYQHLIYNENEHTIECLASINVLKDNTKYFFSGFKLALCTVIKKSLELNRTIKRVLIENTSHNHIILDYIKKIIPKPHLRTPCAFFLYNYISYSNQPSSCFILY